MKKTKIINNPVRVSELSLEDLWEVESDEQDMKAARMQVRRWRKLKHQLV